MIEITHTGTSGVIQRGVVVSISRINPELLNVCMDSDPFNESARIVAIRPTDRHEFSRTDNLPSLSNQWRKLWEERFEWVSSPAVTDDESILESINS